MVMLILKFCAGPHHIVKCLVVTVFYFELLLGIGESPNICPFLKNNGDEAPRGPESHYFSGMDRYSDSLLLKIHLNQNIMYFDRH